MSEKEFRPRLSSKEIQFLLELVKYTRQLLDEKEQAYKSLETRIRELTRELRIGNMDMQIVRELKASKQQLQNASGLPMWILHQRFMCRSLTRRLHSILKGGKAHRTWVYNYNLNDAVPQTVEPKQL